MDKKIKIAISLGAVAIVTVLVYVSLVMKKIDLSANPILPFHKEEGPKMDQFTSSQEFADKMDDLSKNNRQGILEDNVLFSAPMGSSPSATGMAQKSANESAPSGEFSATNVQVQGVDEADIVKTDGQYIYTVTNNYLTISKAAPAEEATLTSKTELANSQPQEILINGDKLLIFGRRNYPTPEPAPLDEKRVGVMPSRPAPYSLFQNVTFVDTYDISDRSNPKVLKRFEFDGDYKTSRMIGNYVYAVFNSYPRFYMMGTDQKYSVEDKCSALVPQYREGLDLNVNSPTSPLVDCLHIHYIKPIYAARYATIIAINLNDPDQEMTKEVILGAGDNIYASEKNIYLADTDYGYDGPMPLMFPGPNRREESTKIYKFQIEDGKIDYAANGSVPGTVLNQFSMDESNGYFRIATTVGHVSRDMNNSTSNNVYILDQSLDQTGKIEDIAPGEKIYSARFMGDRAFLVTFKKVDPFFTLDLSDPKNPQLLGKLKIPGYSDYLHPYDENHIIGIGKNTVEASETLNGTANFAWYQGIKMAMFDVTDYNNPKEMYKIEIGDRGTDSPILNDHKALLFSKDKNLLVIPVLLAQLADEQKKNNQEGNNYGDYVYQGAYVFDINLDNGFNLRGRITHFDDNSVFKKSGYYFGANDLSIRRSLYIGDDLYTISDSKIKVNRLNDLGEVKTIDFNLPKPQEDGFFRAL